MKQTAARLMKRTLCLAMAIAVVGFTATWSLAQEKGADDIFAPSTPQPSTQPPANTEPPANTQPQTPATESPAAAADTTSPAPTTPATPTTPPDAAAAPSDTGIPGVEAPGAEAPAERPARPEFQDAGREIDPQAKIRLQDAYVEAQTRGGDLQKAVSLAEEAIAMQRKAHPEPNNQLYEGYLLIGSIMLRAGDFERAVALFDAALQANPTQVNPAYVSAILAKGQAHLELKEYRQAEETLTNALNVNSQLFDALYLRGKARTELRDYEAAMEDLQEATSINRVSKEAFTALGKVQLLLGDGASAQASLDRAVKLDGMLPKDQKSTYAEVYFERGKLYASSGQLEKSAADMAIAVERDPKHREYLMNLGAIRHEIAVAERDPTQFPLAIEALKRAIDAPKKPEEEKDVSPIVALARTYIEQGNMEEDKDRAAESYRNAVATANDAIKIEPKAAMAFYQRGVAQRMLENLDAATASLTEAIKLAPAFAQAYYRRGIIWYNRGEYRVAGQDFEDALRVEAGNPKYLVWRGVAYAREEKYIDAIDAYTLALRANPMSSRAYHNRALAYLAIGEEEKAVADFNQAIRIDARDAAAFYRRGVALDRLGESEKALDSLTRAIELKDGYADALMARGRLYQRTGNGAKAATDFAAAKKTTAAK